MLLIISIQYKIYYNIIYIVCARTRTRVILNTNRPLWLSSMCMNVKYVFIFSFINYLIIVILSVSKYRLCKK